MTVPILHDWPSKKAEVQEELRPYWSFRDKVVFIDGITIKGQRTTVPGHHSKKRDSSNYHINHMGTIKTRMVGCKSIYWVNMNANIEQTLKNYHMCLDFQTT